MSGVVVFGQQKGDDRSVSVDEFVALVLQGTGDDAADFLQSGFDGSGGFVVLDDILDVTDDVLA